MRLRSLALGVAMLALAACGSSSSSSNNNSTYTLTVSMSGSASGAITATPTDVNCSGATCTQTYAAGTTVTIDATPESGATASFSGCDQTSGNSCTVAMNADKHVTVTFNPAAVVTHALSVTLAGTGTGTVSATGLTCSDATHCGGSYDSGTVVTLTATPDNGGTVAFTGCDSTSGDTCTVTMSADKSVTATFTAAVQGEVSNLNVQPQLVSVSATWTAPSGATGVTLYQQAAGGSWVQVATLPASTTSYTVSSLMPGTLYHFKLTSTVGGTESAGVTFDATTAFSGMAADFASGLPTYDGGNFGFLWNADTIFFGVTSASQTSLLQNDGDALWIAIDTDNAGGDATGNAITPVGATGNLVIWPFKADQVIEVRLSGGSTVVDALDPNSGAAIATPASLVGFHGSVYDELAIGKTDLNANGIRFAAVVLNATSGGSVDLSPVNANATDTLGYYTSLTAGLDPGAGAFDTTASGAILSPASALVTFTATDATTPTGPLMIMGSVAPLSYDLGKSSYQLLDDGTHGDATAGDGVYTGVFNFGGSASDLYFQLADNGTAEPNYGNGVDRLHTLTGFTESLATIDFGTHWDATNAYTLQFLYTDTSGNTNPTIVGNLAGLGGWDPTMGLAVTSLGNNQFGATLSVSNYDPATGSANGTSGIQFKIVWNASWSSAENPQTGSGNHELNDDVIMNQDATPQGVVLKWTANDGTTW